MSRRSRLAIGVVIALCGASVGCGSDDGSSSSTDSATGPFCEAMAQLIVLLEPQEDSPPDRTKATFATAAAWFDQARRNAPDAISDDFAVYSAAYDEYARYLSTVGYDLDVVFGTPEGRRLAIDTSHTLTHAIVGYVTDECDLPFGEPRDPPTD